KPPPRLTRSGKSPCGATPEHLCPNICDCHAQPLVIYANIIEIVAAYLAGWHIDAADLKSINRRRFRREQNSLNVPGDLQVMIQTLLFVSHGVNDRVVERKGRLLGKGFKNDEVPLRKRHTHRAVGERQYAEILVSIPERRRHNGLRAKCAAAQFR